MHGPKHNLVLARPPEAARRAHAQSWHGVKLVDNYAWLRADNWQDVMRDPGCLAPDIRAYLEAENAYTDAQLADTRALQETLFQEMKGRLKQDESTVPAPDGPFEYYTTYVEGGQYPRLCRRPRGGGAETLLLDGNAEARGLAYWDLGGYAHSPDHKLLAYATDDKGSELFTIRFRDLATGADLPDAIADTRGDIVWANDGATLFYVRLDEHHRPLFVYRHRIGTPAEEDVLVYAEPDIGFYVGLAKTQSSKFVLIDAHDHETSETRIIDADAPETAPRLVARRRPRHQYQVEHHGARLIITTNSGGAVDFRICEAPLASPAEERWCEIVPHRPGRLILDTAVFSDHMARLEREASLPRIVIRSLADGSEHTIAFAEEAYALGMSPGYEFDTPTLRFSYSS